MARCKNYYIFMLIVSPTGIKREMSRIYLFIVIIIKIVPIASSNSPNSQVYHHHHKERPKSMTILTSSIIHPPTSPSSDEVNNNSSQTVSSSTTTSSDSDEMQFNRESFNKIYRENKEINKRCKDLLKSNKTLKEQVEIFSLRSDNLGISLYYINIYI